MGFARRCAVATVLLDAEAWAEQQFATCILGDKRRTKRLVSFAAQSAHRPDASTPEQSENWTDCKAAYRLFDQTDVTFEAVTAPHRRLTRNAMCSGVWLIINDTTELNFGYRREIENIGRIGSESNRGFFLHTALAVRADSGELAGAVAQELYTRPLQKIKRVSSAKRKKIQHRETDVWGRVIDQVGPSPDGVHYVHVCDRGADNFDIYCHLVVQRVGWVIRAAQLQRRVRDERQSPVRLDAVIRRSPCLGTSQLQVKANQGQPARTAHMEVRTVQITLPRPKTGVSRYARSTGLEVIPMWVVEARETSRVPKGVEPLRWVLMTSETATTFEQAWKIIEYYERRPLIEEFHKCLKTGCSVESRLYRKARRLAPVIGLACVLSVRLLQLKQVARKNPECPAEKVVPKRWLAALRLVLRRPRKITTVRDFIRALASLGGFLGRKGDGEPGWQTIWRGLDSLLLCLRGAESIHRKCG
jgi:hypothetical protein